MKIPIQELPTNQLNALISEWSDALQIKQGQNLKLDLSRVQTQSRTARAQS